MCTFAGNGTLSSCIVSSLSCSCSVMKFDSPSCYFDLFDFLDLPQFVRNTHFPLYYCLKISSCLRFEFGHLGCLGLGHSRHRVYASLEFLRWLELCLSKIHCLSCLEVYLCSEFDHPRDGHSPNLLSLGRVFVSWFSELEFVLESFMSYHLIQFHCLHQSCFQ